MRTETDTQLPEDLLADGCLPIDRAVEWSGIGRTRLYDYMGAGRLPYVVRGRRRLIPRVALRRLLAEGLVGEGDAR